jgi:radical SAM-linked protein
MTRLSGPARALRVRRRTVIEQVKETGIELRLRLAVRFVIEGDLRFISHHDTMRLFERALSRAGLPVRFSQGFNPRPRLSLPLPRPVGVAGDEELLLVDLNEPLDVTQALERLSGQMPDGIRLTEARLLEGGRTPKASGIEYTLPLPAETLEGAERLLAAETWWIERSSPGRSSGRRVDLRAFIDQIEPRGASLWMKVRVMDGSSLRPAELLTALGVNPQEGQHRMRRTAIHWEGYPGLNPSMPGLTNRQA